MAYQVIARKYRPQRFEEVIGQSHVTRTLSHAIEQNRIAHAYLFCGPRGTGKTTLARIFAKCLNCKNGPSIRFEEDDARCQEIAEGRCLDVIEIDGASNRGIEEIRELRETIRYVPSSSKFKIYIIDEVHMLTKEAFNALLKTLEEPPSHAKFMFATTEPEKVLPTILSRCQRFDLRPIPIALIVQHLAKIASLEKVKVDESALRAIARGAEGGMRDAQSTLDQLISFCGQSIAESDVLSMFGMASRDQILDLAKALIAGDALTMLERMDALLSEGKEISRLLGELLAFFRNLLLFELSKQNAALLQVSESELSALQSLSGKLPAERLSRAIEVLSDCDCHLKNASAKRIFFEIALIKAIEATQSIAINEVLKTLKRLRSQGDCEVAQTNFPSPKKEIHQKRISHSPASSPIQNENASPQNPKLSELWPRVLSFVKGKSSMLSNALNFAKPLRIEGRELLLSFPSQAEDCIAQLKGEEALAMLGEAFKAVGLGAFRAGFVASNDRIKALENQKSAKIAIPPQKPARKISQENPLSPSGIKASRALSAFEKDPMIAEALRVFRGQIVEDTKFS